MTKVEQKRKPQGDPDSHWDTTDSLHDGVEQIRNKKKRLQPAQRRRKTRSEHKGPSYRSISEAWTRGTGTRAQSCHVSAPLSAVTNGQRSRRNQRRRAQQERDRNGQSSESSSAITSLQGSSTAPSEILHPPVPTVRLPSSSDNVFAANGSQTAPGSNSAEQG